MSMLKYSVGEVMNNWIRKNFNLMLIIFILLQPILDLITGLYLHVWNIHFTLGIVIRMLFLVFVLYCVLFVFQKRKSWLFYGLFVIYSLFYLFGILVYKDNPNFFGEIQGLCRCFYFPILLVSLYNIRQEIHISNLILMVVLITYLVCIMVPNCLNLGFASYEITKAGTLGFFNSANEISGIISLLTPIMILVFISIKKIIPILLIFILYIFVILTIGTKTPLLSFGITIIFSYLWFLSLEIKFKKIKKIIVSFIVLIFFCISIILILPKTNFYKNIETHLDFLEVDNVFDVFHDNSLIDHFIFSQRLTFLKQRQFDYQNASNYQKLFGIGYFYDGKETKAVEMDYFDIYYSHGIVGFLIYFLIYGYIFYLIMKNRKSLDFDQYMLYVSIILGILLSFIVGHIIVAPSVSILYIVLLLSLEKKEKKRILLLGQNLDMDKAFKNIIANLDFNKYDVTVLLITKEDSHKYNFSSNVNVMTCKFISCNNFFHKLKLVYYIIISYCMYDSSYCYQKCDEIKNTLGYISSLNYNIYMDSTNFMSKELLFDKVKYFLFKTQKDKKKFLLEYPMIKDKCILLDKVKGV